MTESPFWLNIRRPPQLGSLALIATAEWWQWALGAPATVNPVDDTTGEFCAQR